MDYKDLRDFIQYLESIGKEHVLVASYDALDQAKQAIREGKLQATVDQNASEQGYQGVFFAHSLLGGKTFPPITLIDTTTITIDNIDS